MADTTLPVGTSPDVPADTAPQPAPLSNLDDIQRAMEAVRAGTYVAPVAPADEDDALADDDAAPDDLDAPTPADPTDPVLDASGPPPTTPTTPPLSRRAAADARAREALTAAETRAQQAEQAVQQAATQLNQAETYRQQVWNEYEAEIGTPAQIAELTAKITDSQDWDEGVSEAREQLATFKRNRERYAPLVQKVTNDIGREWGRGFQERVKPLVVDVNGREDAAAFASIYQSPNGADALAAAIRHATTVTTAKHERVVNELKETVADLRTKLAAHGVQPTPTTGRVAPTRTVPFAVNALGLPTEESIRLAASGGMTSLPT